MPQRHIDFLYVGGRVTYLNQPPPTATQNVMIKYRINWKLTPLINQKLFLLLCMLFLHLLIEWNTSILVVSLTSIAIGW